MSRITTGVLPGPAGDLEYLLGEWTPAAGSAPRRLRGAVVCHPHPLFGGTLHSRTVFHIARALEALGADVLRFNFRGVGKSQGSYGQIHGEVEDLRAALDFMAARCPAPLVLAGFSFGSMVALWHLAAVADPRIAALLAIGTPANRAPLPTAFAWSGPKLLISGTTDEYGSVANVKAFAAQLPPPTELHFIPGADHYLNGRYPELAALIAAHLRLPAPE